MKISEIRRTKIQGDSTVRASFSRAASAAIKDVVATLGPLEKFPAYNSVAYDAADAVLKKQIKRHHVQDEEVFKVCQVIREHYSDCRRILEEAKSKAAAAAALALLILTPSEN